MIITIVYSKVEVIKDEFDLLGILLKVKKFNLKKKEIKFLFHCAQNVVDILSVSVFVVAM